MAIKVVRAVAVECDDCGYTYDELDVTPAEEMEQARKYGMRRRRTFRRGKEQRRESHEHDEGRSDCSF